VPSLLNQTRALKLVDCPIKAATFDSNLAWCVAKGVRAEPCGESLITFSTCHAIVGVSDSPKDPRDRRTSSNSSMPKRPGQVAFLYDAMYRRCLVINERLSFPKMPNRFSA
jgi:hypothetical protein